MKLSIASLLIIIFIQMGISQKYAERHSFLENKRLLEVSEFRNASFERHTYYYNMYDTSIDFWETCGFEGNSLPTVIHNGQNMFNIKGDALDGESYINLVIRDDGTFEGISQQLDNTLEKGRFYQFSFFTNLSRDLTSPKKGKENIQFSFNNPVILRIWGSQEPCDTKQLLYTTDPIENIEWKEVVIRFKAKKKINWLTIEAYYRSKGEYYDGNVSLDYFSNIYIEK